jgi:lipid-binding SYLF domain-containing protein
MDIRKLLTVAAVCVSFLATGGALANDKTKKQAEVRAKAQQTLNDFYKADANLKAEVEKAAGYAVFTTYGLSFIIGGAGGSGLAHDKKTQKDTFMSLAQASAGVQVGASDTRYLFIFSDAKALQQFIDKGWTAGATAAAGAGVGGEKAANIGAGAGEFSGGKQYMLTKAGLQAGGAVEGTKVWKEKSLN